jgi:coenzyme F420-reducing hydrogenase beta subunit
LSNHIIIEDKKKCMGCTACLNICPKSCISMVQDDEGFLYPKVDVKECIQCGGCKKICPIKEEKIEDKSLDDVEVFACVSKNKDILMESSSGGVFTHLANVIIDNVGVVFGAAYDDKFNVYHTYTENKEELSKFRGSKYVQSDLKNTFKEVREFLLKDKYVLFSGAPCQVAGLKKYLKKDYPNLITCDFICTGVPNPKVYRAYVDYYKEKFKLEVKNIEFRNKTYGWDNFSLLIDFKNKKYLSNRYFDAYIQAHFSHIFLRPACYKCQFKKCNSESDIKLADYWYIKEVHPEIYNYNGVSLVINQSAKGKELFSRITYTINSIPSTIENVIKTNASFTRIVNEPKSREAFLEVIENTEDSRKIVKCIQNLTKVSLKRKVIVWLRAKKSIIENRKNRMV